MLDYGLEGYGLYWYCIELIAGRVDKENITFELEHDARIIARNTGSTVQKVEEMMRYFVKIDLFESVSGVITCLKLARRLDKSMTSNPEMRTLIESMRSHDKVMTQSAKPMQDKIRLDKNIIDKDLRPVGLNVEAWDSWVAFRIKCKFKKYKTDATMKKLIKMGDTNTQALIIQQSIDNEYQGLFPIKQSRQAQQSTENWDDDNWHKDLGM